VSTRIGLISDLHATPEPLQEALSIFSREGVKSLLCAGDIAGYGEALDQTVELLLGSGCRTIQGNHEQRYLERNDDKSTIIVRRYFDALPAVIEMTIEGKSLYMVHASPPQSTTEGIRLLDLNGSVIEEERKRWSAHLVDFEYDILIVGHAHQAFAEWLGSTLVINPGSTKFNHSCAVLTLPEMEVQWFPLSGKAITRAWNWGAYQISRED
jgi:putative phosphoesterase